MRVASATGIISPMASAPVTMNAPAIYRLRVQGRVPLDWSARMMGMNITTSGDDCAAQSTLVGRLPDQAALSGILHDLYEKQYPVLSVECLEIG
jgi:hypothetical protein